MSAVWLLIVKFSQSGSISHMVSEHVSCVAAVVVVSEHVSCMTAVVVVNEHVSCMTAVVVVSEHVSCMTAVVVVSEHVSCMAAVSEVFTSWFSSHMVSEYVNCMTAVSEVFAALTLHTTFFVSALMETVFLPFLLLMNVWTRNVCFFFLFFSFILLNALLSCPFLMLWKVVKGG